MEGSQFSTPPQTWTASPAEKIRAFLTDLAGVDGAGWADVDRLGVITALEELKGASGAAQARVTVAFDASHRAAHADDPIPAHAGADDASSEGERCPSRRREGRGVAEMVALARRESPTRGDQHLGLAKALVHEMPLLHGLLTRGVVSEYVATKVVQGTATLTRPDRATADARLAPVLPRLGPKGAAAAARRVAAELDAASVVKRMAAAARSRRVSVRPAPDGMAYLTILAPLVETVGAFAALGRDADAVVGGHGCQPSAGRSRGQVLADLAIQRLGGLAFGQVQPVEIQLVMTDTALFGEHTDTVVDDTVDTVRATALLGDVTDADPCTTTDPSARDTGNGAGSAAGVDPDAHRARGSRRGSVNTPVEVVGFGPVPAAFIRDRLRHGTGAPTARSNDGPEPRFACADGHPVDPVPPPTLPGGGTDTGADRLADTTQAELAAQVWLRRLYLSPDRRDLVAMDSRRRTFTGLLRQFLVLRDHTCRVPWCEAPIRAIDHAKPVARGGTTTAEVGDGTCVRQNTSKEEPGWDYTVTRTGLDPDDPGPHTMVITTPAGTAYESKAPPLMGWGSEPVDDEHAPRPLMATEDRRLDALQARLNKGEDFDDADWNQYGYLTYLAAG